MKSFCGRAKRTGGTHPAYVSELLPERSPLSIPSHGKGKAISIGTAGAILDELEADLDSLEDQLENEDRGQDD